MARWPRGHVAVRRGLRVLFDGGSLDGQARPDRGRGRAVAAGGGDRAKTTKSVFGLTITNGIIGNFSINSTGDINLTPITIYKQVGKKLVPQKTIIPAANLVGGP